jgi:hypothetical protein
MAIVLIAGAILVRVNPPDPQEHGDALEMIIVLMVCPVVNVFVVAGALIFSALGICVLIIALITGLGLTKQETEQ